MKIKNFEEFVNFSRTRVMNLSQSVAPWLSDSGVIVRRTPFIPTGQSINQKQLTLWATPLKTAQSLQKAEPPSK